jgi:hypothetical protein
MNYKCLYIVFILCFLFVAAVSVFLEQLQTARLTLIRPKRD